MSDDERASPVRPEDVCPRPDALPEFPTAPLVPSIYASAVWRCESPDQADDLLAGRLPGYVYGRDGHPNADLLALKLMELHGADRGLVSGTGMASLAAAALGTLRTGDHVLASSFLYGRSLSLWRDEMPRYGVECSVADTCDLSATRAAMRPNTRLLAVETITNPMLRVSDLAALAEIAHAGGARLLVDNTFASPVVCRPLSLGADLVHESLTKIINGHSDVVLGFIGARISGQDGAEYWRRFVEAQRSWGLSAAPMECWLAARGLATLALRVDRANQNALAAADFLRQCPEVESVHYPGLPGHVDHALARRQFGAHFGSIVTFTLPGGRKTAARFIRAARRIPFCPSLGDLSTTLSHPESTSHRGATEADRASQGISGGTIRLSVGIESEAAVLEALDEGLRGTR